MSARSPRRSFIQRLITLLRSPFGRASDRDLDDELRAFIADRTGAHEAAGHSPAAARRAAILEVSGSERVKEEIRNVHPGHHLQIFWRDVVTGTRALRRARGFSAVVIATLALGVGASVTMFSVMHAVMWRALPYPDADRLVAVDASLGPVQSDGVSPGAVRVLRASSRMFTAFAMANGAEAFLTVGDQMERVSSASATDDMLGLLGGVPLVLGRPLDAAVDVRDDTVVSVVISHRLWQRVFHGAPDVLGRRVEINNREREIVGVLPADFRVWLPASAGVDENVDVWFPNPIEDSGRENRRPAIAKLAPGASLAQGQAELDVIARQLMADRPEWFAGGLGDSALRLRARPLRDVVAAPVERGLLALGAAVAFVFLIGCVNIANLMLARSKTRERDIAVRMAIGATRLRIVRQLITEDLVLAAAGTAAGLVVARGGIALVAWLRPVNLPRQSEIAIDTTVALVAVVLSILPTLLCGLLPALRLAGGRGALTLVSLRSAVSVAGGRRLQRTLVIAEVALSIVPLVAAGLMLRTFVNLSQAPLGFDPSNILTANVGYSYQKFPDVTSTWPLHRDAVAAVRRLPGVDAVSAASPLPLAPVQVTLRFRRDGDPSDQGYAATRQTILPGYLSVMRIPLLGGREFTDEDIAARRDVAIVDERFAQALWAGSGIGQRFRMGSGQTLRVLEVVGVTPAMRVKRVR